MTNSYLLEIIKALQPEERDEMARLLSAPQFNRSGNAKELLRLYQIILDTAPEFSAHLLQKHEVYFQIFSEPTIVQGKLEKLMAELNKLLRSYALVKKYLSEDNELQQQIDWASWLRERGLQERSRQVVTKLKAQKGENEPESLGKYREALLISEEVYLWEGTHNQLRGDLGIPDLIFDLELYYLNYKSELKNRYLLQQKGPQLPDLAWINKEDSFWQSKSVLLRISTGINSITGKSLPAFEEFQQLMQLLQNDGPALSAETLAQFYAYLRNTCTLLIDAGNLEFIPLLHEIHKDNLERHYFFINEEMSPNVYLNLVQIATRARQTDWAKNFTEDYKSIIIGGDEAQFFYRLNMAQCLFAEGKFDEALNYIPDTPSASHYHHIARRLELKIYYELDSDLLHYKMEAFRKFIERTASKNIATNLKTLHVNFVHFLLQISQSPRKDKKRSAQLIARINSKTLVAERSWLLEKARELG
ncbi:MAG: hypothetical protein ACKVU0_01530 [Saprospiraceae bacterium]